MRVAAPVAGHLRPTRPIGFRKDGKPIWPISGGASALQQANAQQQRYTRQPQTTTPGVQGGSFVMHSRESTSFQYQSNGNAFGAVIAPPLTAVAGFLRSLEIRVTASGGAAGNTPAVAAADAPWSIIQNLLFRDAFSQPLHTYSGYELFLLNLFSGQTGFWSQANPALLPSFSGVDADGNFTFRVRVPFELFESYCSIPMASQSAMATLRIQLGLSTDIYTANHAPDTLPTIDVGVQANWWSTPLDDPNLAPEQDGSTTQWFAAPAATSIGSGASSYILFPQQGGWCTTFICEFRDSTGARTDSILPSDDQLLELAIDQITEYAIEVGSLKDQISRFYGVTRPAGVLVFTYRDSLANVGPISMIDNGITYLPTTPGSQILIRGLSWGTFANAPAQMTVTSGRLLAVGGIPYTHLAD